MAVDFPQGMELGWLGLLVHNKDKNSAKKKKSRIRKLCVCRLRSLFCISFSVFSPYFLPLNLFKLQVPSHLSMQHVLLGAPKKGSEKTH